MLDADAVDELRAEISPRAWRLLLKLGLCIGCEVALKEAMANNLGRPYGDYDELEDDGDPFPEEDD